MLVAGEIVGMWRPRRSGRKLSLQVQLWDRVGAAGRRAVQEQAERLAAHRQVEVKAVAVVDAWRAEPLSEPRG